MVDLPLIVERPDDRMWFGDDGSLTDGRLWAEHDAQLRSETDRIGHDLRENLFGDDVWKTFEPGTRAFLASGEASFRGRRHDPAFDFSAPAIAYAKAVETEINTLLFSRLRRFYGKGNPIGRHTTVDGKPMDLGDTVSHQTLGTIINLLQHNEDVKRGIRGAFVHTDVQWLLGELPHYLEPIARLRNPAAHSQRLSQNDAGKLREQTLGIGQEGLLVRIARAKLRQLTA
ncbi:MAG TPA: hypothetical protein VK864_07380, partial [Longimicrobiales bacterium]|nr:hypothetical protein [Longimicrobiales bacterium]